MKGTLVRKKRQATTCICAKSLWNLWKNEILFQNFDFKGVYKFSKLSDDTSTYLLTGKYGDDIIVTKSEFKEYFVPIVD